MCVKILLLALLLSCYKSVFCDTDIPTVEVMQGTLQGKILKSRDGRESFGFIGVPYAQAERFETPTMANKWSGVLQATKYGPRCAQKMWITNANVGSEDCLHLQVFTPSLTGRLPVMVYFHGGGFTIGTGNILQPDYFMDEDVVLVLVNYRLGPLGFLSMQDNNLPGNNGLKDQNMALRWVQANIVKFGGNSRSVTIFGNSAGGASVISHILSPQSSGLFYAAIAQSGSILNPWAMSRNPKLMAMKFGKSIGCPTETSKELKECLLTKTTEEILNAMEPMLQWGYDPFTPFGIVIEPDLPGAFIVDEPLVSFTSGHFNKVPIITGVTEDEGLLMNSAYISANPELLADINENWEKVLPIALEFDELYTNLTRNEQVELSKKIRKFYFHERVITEEAVQPLTDVYSDRLFNHGIRNTALLIAEHAPVYMYQFAHNRGDYSVLKIFNIDKILGVSHAEELSFLFADSFGIAPEFQKGSTAEKVSKNLVKVWVAFADNGYRGPYYLWGTEQNWKSVSLNESRGEIPLKYYRMDTDTSIIDEPFTERIKFWEDNLSPATKHNDEL